MTDRIHSLTVALEKDVREDDIKALVDAIMQFRGVVAITTRKVNADTWMAEQRAKRELHDKLFAVIYPDIKKE